MRTQLFSFAAAVALSATFVAAQSAGQNPPDPQKPTDVTMTGCLVQGSGPMVFVLDNARINPTDKNENAKTFVVEEATSDLMLNKQVNHEVTVTGLAEQKTAPVPAPGQKAPEKDLPKFRVKALMTLADVCSVTR